MKNKTQATEKQTRKDKPTPVRLGELKPIIQRMASEEDRSMHYLIIRALRKEYLPVR